MNAKPLLTADKEEGGCYCCSECFSISRVKDDIELCCTVPVCECGEIAEITRFALIGYESNVELCEKCREIKELVEYKSDISGLKVVQAPTTGYVCSYDAIENYVGDNEDDVCIFKLDDIEIVYKGRVSPLFVYNCKEDVWNGIDVADFIACEFAEFDFCGMAEGVKDLKSLTEFVANWNSKQDVKDVWICDDEIIILKPEEFKAWLISE